MIIKKEQIKKKNKKNNRKEENFDILDDNGKGQVTKYEQKMKESYV